MTPAGVIQLIRTMESAYPNYHPKDVSATAKLWQKMLERYTDSQVAAALHAYIVGTPSEYAPSIGQIVALMHTHADEMSEMEAWNLVAKAIRNGNYGAEEEFAKLPAVVQLAVGSPAQIRGWAQMDVDSMETVAQSNFLRSYRACKAREEKAERMPDEYARLFRREPEVPTLETHEDNMREDGIPMPEELRRRLDKWR